MKNNKTFYFISHHLRYFGYNARRIRRYLYSFDCKSKSFEYRKRFDYISLHPVKKSFFLKFTIIPLFVESVLGVFANLPIVYLNFTSIFAQSLIKNLVKGEDYKVATPFFLFTS